jgi:hypothetical protein
MTFSIGMIQKKWINQSESGNMGDVEIGRCKPKEDDHFLANDVTVDKDRLDVTSEMTWLVYFEFEFEYII